MSDMNERAKRGQALNLAVHSVVGRKAGTQYEEDTNFKEEILRSFLFYYSLSELVQNYDIDVIKEVITGE